MKYQDLILYSTLERFYIVGRQGNTQETLCIPRLTTLNEQPSLLSNFDPSQIISPEVKRIEGIFGSIELLQCKYLIVISSKQYVGIINGKQIFQMLSCEIIPYKTSDSQLTENQRNLNRSYLAMITSFLQVQAFYFAYEYSLTCDLQTMNLAKVSLRSEFAWNWNMLGDFLFHGSDKFLLPIIHGFFCMKTIYYRNKTLSLTLISRRSTNRAGTRLFSRGIDSDGHVSNFVETEQIIDCDNKLISFVQVRGSIPLFWEQMPNLKYKPAPKLEHVTDDEHKDAFRKHISHLRKTVILNPDSTERPVLMINLINHTGAEKVLLNKLDQIYSKLGDSELKLENFDFHHECRRNRWDRLSILIDRISEKLVQFGCYVESDEKSSMIQRGLIRTNCIDSLDRTNVVQSLLAKRILESVLKSSNLLEFSHSLEGAPEIYTVFRNVWADNADVCSTQYAGTPALKTDFTRTGQRTIKGAMNDGFNSLFRYWLNNFEDGSRQDGIDLVLGKYKVRSQEGKAVLSPLSQRSWVRTSSLLILIMLLLSSFSLVVFYSDHFLSFNLLFWAMFAVFSILYLRRMGRDCVDFPTLAKQAVSVQFR